MRRSTPYLVLLVAAVAAALGVWRPGSEGRGGGGHAEGRVTRVVDGDTIHVWTGGHDEAVRYIGVDTPESVKPGTPVQCFAKAASAENERLVAGRRVRLVYDAERRDRYGRLLAYVYRLAPAPLLVNAELVRAGYARTLTIPPNVRFAGRFAALAREARVHERGLWRRC
jgi:micrococcal nuclease